jgi:3-hydroxyacyl-[acyl-carrier-protein] dehydratase
MAGKAISCEEVLALIPHRPPFRFIDALDEIDELHARGRYRFRPDEPFYAGHFPGAPITPGVILIETMAQTGVVALGIYLFALEAPLEELVDHFTVFSEGEVEFSTVVRPGDEVIVEAEKVFFRRKKIRSRITLRLADGRLAASGVLSGMGVRREAL